MSTTSETRWRRARSVAGIAAVLLAASSGLGCRRDPPPEPAATAAVVVEAASPEQLPEGRTVVLGLRLPVGAKVRGETSSSASILVSHPLPRVNDYLLRHLREATTEEGPGGGHVFVGWPREDGPRLRVVAARTGVGTALLVSLEPLPVSSAVSTRVDFTPETPFATPDEAERKK